MILVFMHRGFIIVLFCGRRFKEMSSADGDFSSSSLGLGLFANIFLVTMLIFRRIITISILNYESENT